MAKSDEESFEEEEENFDDEDEEYEEDEEEESSSSKNNGSKRLRSERSDFFDDEAEVDDDDDDEYEGDDGEEEEGFAEHSKSHEQSRKDRDAYSTVHRDRKSDLDGIIEKVHSRYAGGGGGFSDADYDDEEEYDELPKQSYWRLKCRVGEEKMFVASMMQKMLNNKNSANPNDHILIKSIMAPQHLAGYVYVEAEREVHVRQAIRGTSSLQSFTPVITPLKDIIEVISANKKNIDLKKGSWVRIKLGKYKGDIGQIFQYDSAKARATVKLIPRLDLVALAQANVDKETAKANGGEKTTAADKGNKRKRTRPQARFFNPDEVEKMKIPFTSSGSHLSEGQFYLMSGDKYKDGFLYKVFRVPSIISDGVVPALEELQKFQDREDKQVDEDGNLVDNIQSESTTQILPRVQTKATHFAKGDTVKVVSGDLKNLMAVVESVEEDRVLILPVDEQIKDLFAFKPYELQKYFKVGDHVKAIGGRYEGETGMVLRVDDLQVVLLSDLTMSEIKVKPQDLQECTEVATGRLELGNYELHDLVQIGLQKVGVIIKVERDSFKILDESSNVSTVKLQEVGNKKKNRNFTTLDAHHNTITAGDLIEIVDGSYKGKQGTILHISRNFLFIKSKDVFENGGVFVVRTQYCSLLGGNKNKALNIQNQQQQSQQQSQNRGFGGGGNRNFGDRNNNDRGGDRNNNSQGGDRNNNRGGFGDRNNNNNDRGDRNNNNNSQGGGGYGGPPQRGGYGGRGREDSPLHKVVTIKKGAWKGYVGIVKECTDTMVQVELQTNSKKVTVQKTDIVLPHEKAQLQQQQQQQSSSDWEQMAAAGRTPIRGEDPSTTPMRMSTPRSTNDPWTMRESQDYFSGGNNNNNRDRDYNRDDNSNINNNNNDGYGTTTPGTSYSLYSPYTPNTPLDGSNRHGDSNYTPSSYDRSTPIGGQYQDNPTPSYMSGYSTPHNASEIPSSPYTPHNIPQTPATPNSSEDHDEEIESLYWSGTKIEVVIKDSGKHAVVLENTTESTCKIELLDSSKEILDNVSQSSLTLVAPAKKDRVVIVKGKLCGQSGALFILTDENTGIVKMNSNFDFKVFKMSYIGKVIR